MGIFPEDDPGPAPWNRRSTDNDVHRGKLGLTLELNTPEGADLFKRLVAVSDVVLENFSPRVMPNFGLDYSVLQQHNPAIIMCSMSGYGQNGPCRDHVSFGSSLEPFSGLASLVGYAGEKAHLSGNAYPDPAAALHAAGAILTAFYHKLKTGLGQYIDLSQAESATSLMGEVLLGYCLSGKVPLRMGNRHPEHAPQGCYRSRGTDRWVVIAVSTAAEWEALCRVMGHPEWQTDSRFRDAASRRKNQDDLDGLIGQWTCRHSHHAAMHLLQAAGVPAGAVLDARELTENEHLRQRAFFCEIDHPEAGMRKYCQLPIKVLNQPEAACRPAPCLGEHNHLILEGLLGLSETAMAALEEKNIIGTRPL